ncbi:uncharacterized protein [Typha angustifolia]|uniref:uncharacterized protein n=1 Tax=Typha angustifolia TaxID=59011 RepID=UPI003C2DCA88
MATESTAKGFPKVVKLDKALKLAEAWVNNMSGSTANEPSDKEIEGRPSRLGLGARVTPNAKFAPSTDPVERKLLAKVNAKKRQSSPDLGKTSGTKENDSSNDEADEPESRTSAFVKKKVVPLSTSFPSVKRRK